MIKKDEKDNQLIIITNENTTYMFDKNRKIVYDNLQTGIKINYDIMSINKNNLFIILNQLFDDYYKMIEKFEIKCMLDRKNNTKWRELK